MPAESDPARRALRHALAAGGLALLLYLITACPTLFAGDSAEFAGAAACFGVPHPPGYPLYTLLTALVVALTPGEAAWVANLMSGVYAAVAVGLAFLCVQRLGARLGAAWFAALLLATGRTFWSQAVVAEVYTFDLMLLFALLLCALLAARSERPRAWSWLALCAVLLLGHRAVNVLYLLPVVVLLWSFGAVRAACSHWKQLLLGGALGLLPLLYVPLASLREPAFDIGDPDSFERWWTVFRAAPYTRHFLTGDPELAWGRVREFFAALPVELGAGGLLAPYGMLLLLRGGVAARKLLAALLLTVLAGVGFAYAYQILDINVYYLPALAALCVLAAIGADGLLERAGDSSRVSVRFLTVLLLLCATPGLQRNGGLCDQSDNTCARRLAEDILDTVEDDALVFVNGDTTIHSLWYLQRIEGRKPGVIVYSLGHEADWYLEELLERHPDAAWPLLSATRPGLANRVLSALSEERPVYLSRAIDPRVVLGRLGPEARFDTFPFGVLLKVLPVGTTYNPGALSLRSARLLEASVATLPSASGAVDLDTKSIYVQYAVALAGTAEQLKQRGDERLTRGMYELLLTLEPDRHQRDIEADALRLGQEIPPLRLGEAARGALIELDSGT